MAILTLNNKMVRIIKLEMGVGVIDKECYEIINSDVIGSFFLGVEYGGMLLFISLAVTFCGIY